MPVDQLTDRVHCPTSPQWSTQARTLQTPRSPTCVFLCVWSAIWLLSLYTFKTTPQVCSPHSQPLLGLSLGVITESSEIFQKRLHQALESLKGGSCVADVEQMKNMASEYLCSFNTAVTLEYIEQGTSVALTHQKFRRRGHVVSSSGLKSDPSKIKAALKMEPPKTREAGRAS